MHLVRKVFYAHALSHFPLVHLMIKEVWTFWTHIRATIFRRGAKLWCRLKKRKRGRKRRVSHKISFGWENSSRGPPLPKLITKPMHTYVLTNKWNGPCSSNVSPLCFCVSLNGWHLYSEIKILINVQIGVLQVWPRRSEETYIWDGFVELLLYGSWTWM